MQQLNVPVFFEAYRREFGPIRQEAVVHGLTELLGYMRADLELTGIREAAYMLATVKHESGDTFRPVREAFWHDESWRRKRLRYAPFYGRGYVQLTWERNYRRAGEELGLDLVGDPDLLLEPVISYRVLAQGMREGWFTGRKLSEFITRERTDYLGARTIINGVDRDALVASHASRFERALGCGVFHPGETEVMQA